ncbi:MAG: hypothetical protein ABL921_30675, partial [Pirellula sp.]
GELASTRTSAAVRIGWTTLFVKAFALVSEQLPDFRDVFVRYPRNQLYRHPHSVASISIHRQDDAGNERLIFGRCNRPESMPLCELQRQIDSFCTAPLSQIYREGLILERQPAFVRNAVWWCLMNCSGRKRAKHVGTFSVSSLGGHGAFNAHHPLITTSSLAISPLTVDGECDVVLICDHRTLDGMAGARGLQLLEEILRQEIIAELHSTHAEKIAA